MVESLQSLRHQVQPAKKMEPYGRIVIAVFKSKLIAN